MTQTEHKTPRLRLRLTAAAEAQVRRGHPWVYASSVREQNREGLPGELAVIYDRNDRFLAAGLYDPASPLRVRVLHAGPPMSLDGAWWQRHLDSALQRRAALFGPETTGYRLLNGESDGWPGLVLDRYSGVLVLKLYTAAWYPLLPTLISLLLERFAGFRIVLRLSRNIQGWMAERGLHDGDVLAGELLSSTVTFQEYGLKFEADVQRGQKTGFFLDQRENRRIVGSMIEKMAGPRVQPRVLNAFSFTGGFSLAAARAGAAEVISLDISRHALEGAERNFMLNAADPLVSRALHRTVQADAFEWLSTAAEPPFDFIVLDPPSLAKRESERDGAIKAYQRLSAEAIRRLRPGGTLMAASCSAHVRAEEFFEAVRYVSRRSRRSFRELRTTRHAPDHHATFAEAEYLKAIYLAFD